MNDLPSPILARPPAKLSTPHIPRRPLRLPLLLGGAGGLGLLACLACCTLPLLGALGIVSGAMATFAIVEPLSAGLLALAGIIAVVTFLRARKRCATPGTPKSSCSVDGFCGCRPPARHLSGSSGRVM
jgi:hypothetical protein